MFVRYECFNADYYYSAVTLGNAFAVVTDLKTKVLCSREGILTYFFSVGWFILLTRKDYSPFIKSHTELVKSVGKFIYLWRVNSL